MWEPPKCSGPCFDFHRFDGFIFEAEKPFENVQKPPQFDVFQHNFLLGSRKRLLFFFYPPFVAWKKTVAKLCTLSSALIFSFAQFFLNLLMCACLACFFLFCFLKQDLKRFCVLSPHCGKIISDLRFAFHLALCGKSQKKKHRRSKKRCLGVRKKIWIRYKCFGAEKKTAQNDA